MRLSTFRWFLISLLALTLCQPSNSDTASAAYKRGQRAESHHQLDAAFDAYKQAFTLRPREPKYMAAYTRIRTDAALEHVKSGQTDMAQGRLEDALGEFQLGAEIDPTNFVAVEDARRVEIMLKKQQALAAGAAAPPPAIGLKSPEEIAGPFQLQPSPDTPISLRMTTTADNVYKTIGKLGGINVLFDLDYRPQKISIELNDVKLKDALEMVAMESKTFWRPISSTAIFVASDTRRKDLETSVMKTFYLENASGPSDLQEVVGTLKGMLDLGRVQVNPTHSAITIRGTPDQLVLANKLISDFDKPKPEVIIDVTVMEVSRDLINTLGTTVPTSTTVGPLSSATGGSGTAAGPGTGLVQVASLYGNSIVTAIPSATFTMLMSDSNSKVLQSPEIRALNDEKASLKIGDRVPIATGSYTPGIGGGAISPLVNTQFQYLDVGVNVDITPHVHSEHDVTLKMVLEISTVTGNENIGGISQPIIGQRRIEHEARLEDGEVNLIGGILEDTETDSLAGYPWISKIPILRYLFAQDSKERRQDEIVFAITPHIVRAEDVTEENVRLVDVGTSGAISLHYTPPKPSEREQPAEEKKPDQPELVPGTSSTTPRQTAPNSGPVERVPKPAGRGPIGGITPPNQ